MRRYLFIAANEWSTWGESELIWSQAAEKSARPGMEVRVCVPDFETPIKEAERLRSASCRISYGRVPSLLYRLRLKFSWLPEDARRHLRAVGNGVDLVVVSQRANTDGLPGMEAARAAGYKYVVIVEGATEFYWPDDVRYDSQPA